MKKRTWTTIFGLFFGLFLLTVLVQGAASHSNGGSVYMPAVFKKQAEHWIHHYGHMNGYVNESATAAFPTQDGGFILLIEQEDLSTTDTISAFVIVKISDTGNILWQKGLESASYSEFHLNGQETSDGGLIISGLSAVDGETYAQVIKMTSDGTIQWERKFGGEDWLDYATSIIQTGDGGYLFTGYTVAFGVGVSDLWLVKMTANGTIQWQKTVYGSAPHQHGNAVYETSDGGYIVAGQSYADSRDFWVLKFNSSGSLLWQKKYGGDDYDEGRDIIQTNDGGYLVVGATESSGAGHSDGWILKLNGSGDIVWQKSYGGYWIDEFNAIYPTIDGRFLVAGTTESFGTGVLDFDTWLLLIDGGGNIVWQKTYGGMDDETGSFVRQLNDGKIMVSGYTATYGGGSRDAWVLKLDPNGNVGNCNIIGTSNATVMNTAVTPQSVEMIQQDSSAGDAGLPLSSVDTHIQKNVICEG